MIIDTIKIRKQIERTFSDEVEKQVGMEFRDAMNLVYDCEKKREEALKALTLIESIMGVNNESIRIRK